MAREWPRVMRWFTRANWDGLDDDDPGAAYRDYKRNLDLIWPSLPEPMRAVSQLNLHDAWFRSNSVTEVERPLEVEIAYFTDDVEATAGFYRDLLNSDPVAQSEGMAIFVIGATKLFIHRNYIPGKGELAPENHIAFAVPDVDEACKELTGRGLKIEVEPRTYYWGRSAYLRSPDGQLIELAQEDSQER